MIHGWDFQVPQEGARCPGSILSFDSVIIETHVMEILPDELAIAVKGYKRRCG
jgi:hypothetical protein